MLTVAAIDRMKPRPTVYRVSDTGGLCIEVTPNGSKLWRYRYRLGSKARLMALGNYPQVPLASRKDPGTDTWIKGHPNCAMRPASSFNRARSGGGAARAA